MFAATETEPLAAASIAQVHAVTYGTPAVVKVGRAAVEQRFLTDLRLLRLATRLAERYWPAARVLNPVAIVDDAVATLRQELDFELEAEAMEHGHEAVVLGNDRSRRADLVADGGWGHQIRPSRAPC